MQRQGPHKASMKGTNMDSQSLREAHAESQSTQRRALTVEEAAKELGVGRSTAYLAAKRGEIPTIRIGRRLLVPRAALERLLSGGEPQAA